MQQRRLAAIMFTDIVGYTAMMGSDEDRAFLVLQENRDIHTAIIKKYDGTLIKEMGDGMLISFNLASDAVRCAIEIQNVCIKQDIPLKIGIHEGEMVFDGNDVLGDGVNIASRIQENTEEGCIMVSGSVYRDIKNKPDINTESIGEKSFKNIDESIKVYKVFCNEIHQQNISPFITEQKVPEKKSIIVLPFVNMSPDPDQEYFSDGLTEEIITDLSYIHDLLVISRSSAMTFKGSNKTTKEIADKVNVRYVLEGSVRKAGNNLRITAQLIDGKTDMHLWAKKYSGTLEDVFDIQEKVSQSIVDSLKVSLSSNEKKLISSRIQLDVFAHECLLKARHEIWLGSESSLNRAIHYLNEAKEKVGENIEILSAEAETFFMHPHITGEGMEASVRIMEKNAGKILKIDPRSSYGYLYRGLAFWKKDWGFRQAALNLNRAFDLNPRDPTILFIRATLLCEGGYPDAALRCSDILIELDPITPVNKLNRSFILMFLGQVDLCNNLIKETLSIYPTNSYYRAFAIVCLANMGKKKEMFTIAKDIRSSPLDNWSRMGLLYDSALQGKINEMNEIITPEFRDAALWDETFSWVFAQCFAQVNNIAQSLYWLENAIKRGFVNYPYLNETDPFLENIRDEPRFKELMKRVKYEWEHFEF